MNYITQEQPFQGLAAYLRSEARALPVDHPSVKVLRDWAAEVDSTALAQPAKPVEQPAQPDCRTCYHLRMGYCRVFHRGFVCTNGDKYESAPAVVLWRTE